VPASYELLDAVNTRDGHTTADVAARLGESERDTLKQLREAARDGLVYEDFDESRNVPRDFNRQYWRLTEEGRAVWDKFDEERSN
jgi:DNA-binding MarR family transcriptional regulator